MDRIKHEHYLLLSALNELLAEHEEMNKVLISLGRGVPTGDMSPADMATAAILRAAVA